MTSATAEVPSGIDDVTPQWLTAALGTRRSPTCEPSRSHWTAGSPRCCTELHLTGEDAPDERDRQAARRSEARGAMEMLGGYAREVAFYRHVAGRAPMGTPHVYAARMAEDSRTSCWCSRILQDWDNADHLAGPVDGPRPLLYRAAGRASCLVDRATRMRMPLEAFPSLDTPMTRDLLPAAFGPAGRSIATRSAAPVPAAVAEYAERFAERVRRRRCRH